MIFGQKMKTRSKHRGHPSKDRPHTTGLNFGYRSAITLNVCHNKSICDTKFVVHFRGHNGHQGHKGQKLSVFFFSDTREKVAWGSCEWERTRALSRRITRNAFFYKVFYLWITHVIMFDTHFFFNTAINLQHHFIYLEA